MQKQKKERKKLFGKKQKNQIEYRRSSLDKIVDILSAATEKDKTQSKPKYKKRVKHKKINDWNAKITW